MPDGVAALRRLGVELGAEQGVPFRGIRFLDDRHVAEAAFPRKPASESAARGCTNSSWRTHRPLA